MTEQPTFPILNDEYRIVETADIPPGVAHVAHDEHIIWLGAGLSDRLRLILLARAVSRAWTERLSIAHVIPTIQD